MAILYDGTGGVFTELGKMVGVCTNLELLLENDATAAIEEITGALDDKTAALVTPHTEAIEQFRLDTEAARVALAAGAEVRMLDPIRIINELHLPSTTDLQTTLERFREQMVADSETVKANTVTLGSVTAGTLNDGNGTILISKVLDGYSAPGSNFPADREYNGLDSELCAESETITVECTADSQTSGRQEGAEAFRAFGGVPNPANATPTRYFGAGLQGSGISLDTFIIGPHSGTLIVDPGFESWTGSAPPVIDAWTLDSGVNDTHWKRSTGANMYRGTYGGNFLGDGIQATIQVSQAIGLSRLKPLARYLVTIRYKADATIAAGTLGVLFTGTGYSEGATEKISIAPGSLATSWTLASFWVNLPAILPSDFKLVVKVTGTLTNAKNIYIDDVYVQAAKYFGGVAIGVIHGVNRTCREDRWSFTVANDQLGKFQSFWARKFGRQLPSAGSPTISEALAEADALAPASVEEPPP